MRVFHFLNKKYGLKDIKERRLKIATIMELNDPFELLCLNLSIQELRHAILKTKKDFSKKTGLLCFSKNWSIRCSGRIMQTNTKAYVLVLM